MKRNLNNSKLIAYSAAAGAALAIAPNAFGTIQHNPDANINFGQGNGGTKYLTMEGDNPEISFNGYGTAIMSGSITCLRDNDSLSVCKVGVKSIKALLAGDYIGSATNIPNNSRGAFYYSSSTGSIIRGQWTQDDQTNYFGVSFNKEPSGKVYGWIQVVRLSKGTGKVIAYAYEDETGVAIKAGALPEPAAGLALLALGAAGIARYKRKRF